MHYLSPEELMKNPLKCVLLVPYSFIEWKENQEKMENGYLFRWFNLYFNGSMIIGNCRGFIDCKSVGTNKIGKINFARDLLT